MSRCVRAGLRANGIQKFRCSACKKYQQKEYQKRAYHLDTNNRISQLLVEGVGIRSIARILKITYRLISVYGVA
jgi:insertion element IS1 protein InsB